MLRHTCRNDDSIIWKIPQSRRKWPEWVSWISERCGKCPTFSLGLRGEWEQAGKHESHLSLRSKFFFLAVLHSGRAGRKKGHRHFKVNLQAGLFKKCLDSSAQKNDPTPASSLHWTTKNSVETDSHTAFSCWVASYGVSETKCQRV